MCAIVMLATGLAASGPGRAQPDEFSPRAELRTREGCTVMQSLREATDLNDSNGSLSWSGACEAGERAQGSGTLTKTAYEYTGRYTGRMVDGFLDGPVAYAFTNPDADGDTLNPRAGGGNYVYNMGCRSPSQFPCMPGERDGSDVADAGASDGNGDGENAASGGDEIQNGEWRPALVAQGRAFQDLDRRRPANVQGAIPDLQTTIYKSSTTISLLDRLCKAEPAYANDRAQYQRTLDAALLACRSIAASTNLCVARPGW